MREAYRITDCISDLLRVKVILLLTPILMYDGLDHVQSGVYFTFRFCDTTGKCESSVYCDP